MLDLGCGGGRNTVMLSQKNFNVYGCDSSSAMIRETQEKLRGICNCEKPNERILLSEMSMLPFKNEFFDIILSNGVIHNAFNVEEYKRTLNECYRTLKEESTLYLSIFTSDTIDSEVKLVEGTSNIYITPDGLRMVLFNKEEIIKLLAAIGFRLTDICELYDIQVETGTRSLFRGNFLKENKNESVK